MAHSTRSGCGPSSYDRRVGYNVYYLMMWRLRLFSRFKHPRFRLFSVSHAQTHTHTHTHIFLRFALCSLASLSPTFLRRFAIDLRRSGAPHVAHSGTLICAPGRDRGSGCAIQILIFKNVLYHSFSASHTLYTCMHSLVALHFHVHFTRDTSSTCSARRRLNIHGNTPVALRLHRTLPHAAPSQNTSCTGRPYPAIANAGE